MNSSREKEHGLKWKSKA